MGKRTEAYINIDALHHNYTVIKRLAPKSRILAMVKSNAYGHGLIAVGKSLKEADGFGVACLDEALKLRKSGVTAPIVIMSGVFTPDDLRLVVTYDLQITLHDFFQIQLLQESPIDQPISVWLKIDTGMHRLGFLPTQFHEVYETLLKSTKVKKPITLMTHLADADDVRRETTRSQLEVFRQLTEHLSCPKSIANSAGIIAWPDSIAEWNRPGILLYGISPMLGKIGSDHGLIPVMTLKSKIIAVHDLKRGDAIGYGGCWSCPEDMRVGVIAIGYGDGYPRHAKNGTPILIKEKICRLVGRVSMDLVTVDLRSCPEATIGEDVILWGDGLPAEIVAKYADTIAYELVCNVSQRVVFVYEEHGSIKCEL